MAITAIDTYDVRYSANRFTKRIGLKSGGRFIGQLVFESNGSVLPQDGLLAGLPNLFYHLDDFENVIDLLRNEKPVFLSFTGPGFSNENGINTSAEPIGETEN